MRIGELAERGGVSTKTIRYYESIDLIEEPARTASGYRVYDDADVERLRFIKDAQATGLSLGEIASVLELKSAGERSCAHTTALLEQHLTETRPTDRAVEECSSALAELAERAGSLDPSNCTDPNRCQVISAGRDEEHAHA